jgi:2-polyprenyl-3-methyl-5-hydroxy-6-metoxy-1,4-benzoquinol methylase
MSYKNKKRNKTHLTTIQKTNLKNVVEIISDISDYRGCWSSVKEVRSHIFDESLCGAISSISKDNLKTVVDIGCGNGRYTMYLNENGFDCIGFDGSPLTPEITNNLCAIKDFSYPVNVGKYDLVLCLEVGEHIPVEYEQIFIDNICRAAKKDVILSWALIGQGGEGHVNCRNNEYIITEMLLRGFNLDINKSNYLRERSTLDWFRGTIMYFKKYGYESA